MSFGGRGGGIVNPSKRQYFQHIFLWCLLFFFVIFASTVTKITLTLQYQSHTILWALTSILDLRVSMFIQKIFLVIIMSLLLQLQLYIPINFPCWFITQPTYLLSGFVFALYSLDKLGTLSVGCAQLLFVWTSFHTMLFISAILSISLGKYCIKKSLRYASRYSSFI